MVTASSVRADHYYFKFLKSDTSKEKGSWVQADPVADLSINVKKKGVEDTMIIMEVSVTQYNAGFGALTQQEKDDAIDLAMDDESDYGKWDPKGDATVQVMTDFLNDIRTNMVPPMAELKKNDVKKALKEKLKNKNT